MSDRTKRRRVKARVDEHMKLCRPSSLNNENASPCSTRATVQIPLEHGIPESDTHNDCTFSSTETHSLGLVPQSHCLHGNKELFNTSSVGPGSAEDESIAEQDIFDDDLCSPCISDSDNDSDDNFDTDIVDKDVYLSHGLAAWASDFNIPHVALAMLLALLRALHPHLPKNPRTLLGTAKQYQVQSISGGSYYHFGIAASIKKAISVVEVSGHKDSQSIAMQLNIDGLPLFKSSQTQFWPILGKLVDPFPTKPFIIGIYCGMKKPDNIEEFLHDFVTEMQLIETNQLSVDGFTNPLQLYISCTICDTPARAFVKQVKGHAGYHGCDKCSQKGVWLDKMTFPEVDAPVRTDADFNQHSDSRHHTGVSPLQALSLGMVSQFPLDFMHLVCLGVVRRLLWLWSKSPIHRNIRISVQSVCCISQQLISLKRYIPVEFARKCRSLDEMDRWKATEFRQFLLYSGPIVLKGVLCERFYKHFLLLFVGIYCLVSPAYCMSHCQYAHELLHLFVSQTGQLYGKDVLVYNVHSLIHLAADVQNFGPLDSFSAFPFENFLGKLKKLVRKPNLPLQQVIRRLSEKKETKSTNTGKQHSNIPKKCHNLGPIPNQFTQYSQFQQIFSNNLMFSSEYGNNCVKIRDAYALVRNILSSENRHDDILIVFERFSRVTDFFTYPLESSKLDIHLVDRLAGH